ncbi:hypothetical protein C0058_06935 [Pseudomonas sp. NC02]|nr:hypothetical protein C0058_06935 [Pseudomonas sp. NC02]
MKGGGAKSPTVCTAPTVRIGLCPSSSLQVLAYKRACSRKRCVSHLMYQLIHRIREQARSHILTGQDFRAVRSSAASHPANPTRSAH